MIGLQRHPCIGLRCIESRDLISPQASRTEPLGTAVATRPIDVFACVQ